MPFTSKPTLFILNCNYSSWSFRAWLSLKYYNIDMNVEQYLIGNSTVPTLGPEQRALMADNCPTSKAPVLHVLPEGETDESKKLMIFETLAIMEYMSEVTGLGWPEAQGTRALARSLATEMATSFFAIRNYSMNVRKLYKFDSELYTENVARDVARLSTIWQTTRQATIDRGQEEKDEGFLFGTFTHVDAMYAPIMFRLRTFDLIQKVKGDLALKYVEHLLEMPLVKEWEAKAFKEDHLFVPVNEVYATNEAVHLK